MTIFQRVRCKLRTKIANVCHPLCNFQCFRVIIIARKIASCNMAVTEFLFICGLVSDSGQRKVKWSAARGAWRSIGEEQEHHGRGRHTYTSCLVCFDFSFKCFCSVQFFSASFIGITK